MLKQGGLDPKAQDKGELELDHRKVERSDWEEEAWREAGVTTEESEWEVRGLREMSEEWSQ